MGAWISTPCDLPVLRARRAIATLIFTMNEKMPAAAKTGDDAGMRFAAKGLLSIKYADVAGQAFLRRASEELRDRACAGQADFVARGLIKSIMDSGDGKTCKSGWEAASVDEEYFVPDLLGARPKKQALVMGCPAATCSTQAARMGN
jgi:hypothetical protein